MAQRRAFFAGRIAADQRRDLIPLLLQQTQLVIAINHHDFDDWWSLESCSAVEPSIGVVLTLHNQGRRH